MPITLNGDTGIQTPMYNGTITANAVTPSVNMKNRIINGAMVIDQRNAGASVTGNDSVYGLDRWKASCVPDGKFTMQQSSTAPAGFINSLLVTSTSAYSVASTDFIGIRQDIEGLNCTDLGWGTANAKTITISFWVRSSLTGTFGGSIFNNAGNRSYPFSFTISSANTFEQKSVTIAGDTTGTWLTTNGRGLCLFFNLGSGATNSGTAGAWAGTFYAAPTGATSVVGTNGATFYITGVQLEVGSTATSFDYRSYGTELALCQRYCQLTAGGSGLWTATTDAQINLSLITQMRTAPSVSQTAAMKVTDYQYADYLQSSSSINLVGTGFPYSVTVNMSNFTGATAGRAAGIRPYAANGSIILSAEL